MGVSGALAGAIVMLLVLFAWARAEASSKDFHSDSDAGLQEQGQSVEVCSAEIVSRIFSPEDLKFVSGIASHGLHRLFRRERTAIALHWVQETSAFIGKIMRRHLEASRTSADLDIATEARIFLQYARLKLYCGILFVFIGLLGPQSLTGIALYSEKFLQRIGEGLSEFQLAAQPREPNGSGSL